MAPPEALKNPVADAGVGLRAGIGRRFPNCGHRIGGRFRQGTRTVETSVRPDVRGLHQAEPRNNGAEGRDDSRGGPSMPSKKPTS